MKVYSLIKVLQNHRADGSMFPGVHAGASGGPAPTAEAAGHAGFLLRSLILSYHNKETISFTLDPDYGKKNPGPEVAFATTALGTAPSLRDRIQGHGSIPDSLPGSLQYGALTLTLKP